MVGLALLLIFTQGCSHGMMVIYIFLYEVYPFHLFEASKALSFSYYIHVHQTLWCIHALFKQ